MGDEFFCPADWTTQYLREKCHIQGKQYVVFIPLSVSPVDIQNITDRHDSVKGYSYGQDNAISRYVEIQAELTEEAV